MKIGLAVQEQGCHRDTNYIIKYDTHLGLALGNYTNTKEIFTKSIITSFKLENDYLQFYITPS